MTTPDQYVQIISNELVAAYSNKKDISAIKIIFKEADQRLKISDFNPDESKEFWEKVRKKVTPSIRSLLEKQANSALLALMQEIEKELAARTGASK
jgi:predicted Ser/Thr protein kinase